MFIILTLVGIIFTGNIFCSHMESGGFSLEEGGVDDARQSLMASQISAEIPVTKLQYLESIWREIILVHKVDGQNDSILQKIKEMEDVFPDMSPLTPEEKGTPLNLMKAYKYYKGVWKDLGGRK